MSNLRCPRSVLIKSQCLLDAVLEQIQPTLVLTSASADPLFLAELSTNLSHLPSLASAASTISSEDHEPVKLEYRPPRDFYAGQGKNALAGLRIVEGVEYRDGLGDEEGDGDAYSFGRSSKRRRIGGDDEQSRRNVELRLGSFLSGMDDSPLTVSPVGAGRVTLMWYDSLDVLDRLSVISLENWAQAENSTSERISWSGDCDCSTCTCLSTFLIACAHLTNDRDKHMLINHDALV